jgi:hypothetical protein
VFLQTGRATARNLPRARALYERACARGDAIACTNLGGMHESGVTTAPDGTKARSRYEDACKAGDGDGCYRLARYYESGEGGRRSEMKAADLYEKGCNAGSAAACTSLGEIVAEGRANVAQDHVLATRLFAKGCYKGDGAACRNLGVIYEEGKVVPRDDRCAGDLHARGCKLGDPGACARAKKWAVESGEPVDRCYLTKASTVISERPDAPLNPLGTTLRYGGLVVAGTGAVLIVLGLRAGAEVEELSDEVSSAMGSWTTELDRKVEDGQALERRMKTYYIVGGALVVAGGLISYAGGFFLEETTAPLAIRPAVGPTWVGIEGSF